MSLPPDRISVKRRREEAPIETFFLDEGNRVKRRFTGQTYHFKLLKSPIAPISQQTQQASRAVLTPATNGAPSASHDKSGIPSIRTTAPGDEIADFTRLRQQVKEVSIKEPAEQPTTIDATKASEDSPKAQSDEPKRRILPTKARRFHLTRDLSSAQHSAIKPLGIRKSSSRARGLRPPLPTFIERQVVDDLHAKPPVDRIVNGNGKGKATESGSEDASEAVVEVATFVQPKKGLSKSGFSINHPAATWNKDSDQLADELALLAMELDPDVKKEPSRLSSPPPLLIPEPGQPAPAPRPARAEAEYVYETYIRVSDDDLPQDVEIGDASADNIGVLVIDEEDEELWEGYMNSDDESEYDSDDSNAEDNPSNDYPDEELSSDDEFSRNPYRYHLDHDADEYGVDDSDEDD